MNIVWLAEYGFSKWLLSYSTKCVVCTVSVFLQLRFMALYMARKKWVKVDGSLFQTLIFMNPALSLNHTLWFGHSWNCLTIPKQRLTHYFWFIYSAKFYVYCRCWNICGCIKMCLTVTHHTLDGIFMTAVILRRRSNILQWMAIVTTGMSRITVLPPPLNKQSILSEQPLIYNINILL